MATRSLAAAALLFGGLPAARAAGEPSGGAGWASERELLAHLGGSSAGSEQDELPLLRLCISRSWWQAARQLVQRVHARGAAAPGVGLAPLREEVTALLADVKHQADELAAYADTTFRDQTQGLDEVHCALQWAQNSTNVFLGVKYAARWSAPGAIEVVDVRVNMTSGCFELDGFGHHSSIRKHYTVNISLFGNIVPAQSSWSAASVGRLTANLHKAEAKKWPRLIKTKAKSRHQIGTWLDMEERWASELDKNTLLKKASSKEKDRADRANSASAPKVDKKTKGKRVYTPFQKALQRHWRRLPLRLRRPLERHAVALSAASLGAFLLASLLLLRAGLRSLGKVSAVEPDAKAAASAAAAAADARLEAALQAEKEQALVQEAA